jgi:hypothetical protein
MAYKRRKTTTQKKKKTGVKILQNTWAKKSQKNSFDLRNMFKTLPKTQKRKVINQIASRQLSTRIRTKPNYYSSSKPSTHTRRASSKLKKANANPNANVNMAAAPVAAATKTKGPRVLKAKQLPHIMHSYEGKPEKASTYAHFKHLHEFYLANQTKYSPETDIKIIEHDMKQQPAEPVAVQLNRASAPVLVQPVAPSDAEVDELTALFGSTGI